MPIADTPQEYTAIAQRLIDDTDLRNVTGAAQARFIESFMNNKESCGRVFTQHLHAILIESD